MRITLDQYTEAYLYLQAKQEMGLIRSLVEPRKYRAAGVYKTFIKIHGVPVKVWEKVLLPELTRILGAEVQAIRLWKWKGYHKQTTRVYSMLTIRLNTAGRVP